MSLYAWDFSPDHGNGRLQNSNLSDAIATACQRKVVRCPRCLLVQFLTLSDLCRRCAASLAPRLQLPAGEAAGPSHGEPLGTVSGLSSGGQETPSDRSQLRGKLTRELALGPRLKELRKRSHLTQAQIAAKAGVPRTYISRVERSHLLPGPRMVRRLAGALGMGILDLFQNRSQDPSVLGPLDDAFWNAFVSHFRLLRTEQKAKVIYRVRGMLCERLHRESWLERLSIGSTRRSRLRALAM